MQRMSVPFRLPFEMRRRGAAGLRVVFDHSVFSLQARGGITRYFCELVHHLQQRPDVLPSIIAPLHVSQSLRDNRQLPVTGMYLPKIPGSHRLRLKANDFLSPLLTEKISPDILHTTYYPLQRKIPGNAAYIVTVFDMIHERFADLMPPGEADIAARKQENVRRADHVICISEQTRQDVVELLNIPEEKASVIYLGCSFPGQTTCRNPAIILEPYLLFVGERGGPKNFKRLLESYGKSSFLSQEVALVCFGGNPFTRDELQQQRDLGLAEEKVIQTSGSDEKLINLYSHASALVYPSLYEGFGLPILEAMACGCPVLCSNVSSMPEVAGQAAVFFDPLQIDSLMVAMEKVVQSTEKRNSLIQAGRTQATRFSWQRCADETVEVYKKCLLR